MNGGMISVVTVMRDVSGEVAKALATLARETSVACAPFGFDHEVLIVDNGSTDGTFEEIEAALADAEDARALSLVSSGEMGPAFLAGMEHALGDWVILLDPVRDDPAALPALVAALAAGADVVFARKPAASHGLAYRALSRIFVAAFRRIVGVDLRAQAGLYRGMSRRVIAYVTSHDHAVAAHRALPMLGGFRTVAIDHHGKAMMPGRAGESLLGSVRRGLDLLTSTSAAPLRLATASCAAGAALSLAYSAYAAAIYLFGTNVAPGWTTLSLQIGGMFFLLSLAVAMLSEHVVQMASSSHRRPPYHMAREARSPNVTRERRLNVV